MTNLVVDASSFLDYVLRTARGDRVAQHIENADTELHAPAVCDVEVVSGLRRMLAAGLVERSRAIEALRNYIDLPVQTYLHRWLLGRLFELRENLTAYDATYVALAELLGSKLLTADDRLARAARAHGRCEVLAVSPPEPSGR